MGRKKLKSVVIEENTFAKSLHSSNASLDNEWSIISDNSVKRKWIDDSTVDRCLKCKDMFSMVTRKHHCRNCGNIFCYKCCHKYRTISNPINNPSSGILNSRIFEFNSVGVGGVVAGGLGGGGVSRVCNECCLSVDRQSERYRLWYIFSFLDLKDVKRLMSVSKLYHDVAKSYIKLLVQIHSYPLDRGLTVDERSIIQRNIEHLSGHSAYPVSYTHLRCHR